MSTAGVIVPGALALLAYLLLRGVARRLDNSLAQLYGRLDDLEARLAKHLDLLLTIEDQTISDYERTRREWERMTDVTIDYVRKLAPGDTIELVSRSYIYPHGKALTEQFQFRFERIEPQPDSQFGHAVVGVERPNALETWSPAKFYVTDTRATTQTAEGTVRRYTQPEEIWQDRAERRVSDSG